MVGLCSRTFIGVQVLWGILRIIHSGIPYIKGTLASQNTLLVTSPVSSAIASRPVRPMLLPCFLCSVLRISPRTYVGCRLWELRSTHAAPWIWTNMSLRNGAIRRRICLLDLVIILLHQDIDT